MACALTVPLDRAQLTFDLIVNGESEAIYTTSDGNRLYSTVSLNMIYVPREEHEGQ